MKRLINASMLFMIAGSMMGNQSCQEKPQERHLKRRVLVNNLTAPEMRLPDGGKFDFAYAAKQQMAAIIQKSGAFTTSGVDPSKLYDTQGLSAADDEAFRQCQPVEDLETMPGAGIQAKTLTQISACMMELPHGILSGSIYDFSLVNQRGASLGLANIPGMVPVNGSFDFAFTKSALSVSMQSEHPLLKGGMIGSTGRMVLATANQKSYAKDWKGGMTIGFSLAQLGGNYYSKSSLAQVVEDGVLQSLDALRTEWDKAEPWYAMVVNNCDRYIRINAGSASDMGLKVGDILRVQNMNYEWKDKACASQLENLIDYGVANGAAPVSYVRVTSVGLNVSQAVIITDDPSYPQDLNQTIKPGARVYLEKMVEQVEAAAAKKK